MAGLSYSAHLSQKNSAINSKAKLSGVAKHNLRKYRSLEYDKENIVILWGTDKLVQDVKKYIRNSLTKQSGNITKSRQGMTERLIIILKRQQSQTKTWQWNLFFR